MRSRGACHPFRGTRYFRGIPAEGSAYNPETGLPPLSPKNRLERERKLIRWQQNMQAIVMALECD
jgi:hypothetical protein